jgi:hypothetical protein
VPALSRCLAVVREHAAGLAGVRQALRARLPQGRDGDELRPAYDRLAARLREFGRSLRRVNTIGKLRDLIGALSVADHAPLFQRLFDDPRECRDQVAAFAAHVQAIDRCLREGGADGADEFLEQLEAVAAALPALVPPPARRPRVRAARASDDASSEAARLLAVAELSAAEAPRPAPERDALLGDVDALRDAIILEQDCCRRLRAELKDAERVAKGIERRAVDGTVDFSNASLQRETQELAAAVRQLRDRAEQRQLRGSGNTNGARYRRLVQTWIANVGRTPASAGPAGMDRHGRHALALRDEVAALERTLAEWRAKNGSELGLRLRATREAIAGDRELARACEKEIRRLRSSLEGGYVIVKRTDFDLYEVLREESREIRRQYFVLKDRITPSIQREQRLSLEAEMDALQDKYSEIVIRMERFPFPVRQDELHDSRRGSNALRKEVAASLKRTKEAVEAGLEREGRVAAQEEALRGMARSAAARVDLGRVDSLAEIVREKMEADQTLASIEQWAAERLRSVHPAADDDPLSALIARLRERVEQQGDLAHQKLAVASLQRTIQSLERP